MTPATHRMRSTGTPRRAWGWPRLLALCGLCIAAAAGGGCRTLPPRNFDPAPLPREMDKVVLPDYVIEPPDVLRITAVRVLPLPQYRVQPLDTLEIRASESFPNQPVAGVYTVSVGGLVDLGYSYGAVNVLDMTTEEVGQAVADALGKKIKVPIHVAVSLVQVAALQQIQGEFLVGPDGKVTLGVYGSVPVAGLTREQARAALETHLSKFLFRPQLAIDVVGYNSKVYYLITDGGGFGEQVYRMPITGNETVLDAVSQINGLPAVSSKKAIWLARPDPCEGGACRTYPVDWEQIAECGSTGTNYQLLPGDRVYVKARCLTTADNALARVLSPVERVLGVGLLGSTIARNVAVIGAYDRNRSVVVTTP